MEKIIQVENLSHRFGFVWALRHLSFQAQAGTVTAILGPNASGKSTLLKILATRLQPTEGSVSMLGLPIQSRRAEIRHQIEWLGHRLALYPNLNAKENLQFHYQMKGERPDSVAIQTALEKTGLVQSAGKKTGQISQGQQKRLALARILLTDPAIILLDEPHANLDAAGRHLLNRLLTEWKKGSKTLLLASHEEREIENVCDQRITL